MTNTSEKHPRAEGGRMNAEQKLLPCPFCGPMEPRFSPALTIDHRVKCENCLASTIPYFADAIAITAWNTRPAPTEAEVEAKLEAAGWREAWLFERETRLREQGMKCEQARIIAETEANMREAAYRANRRMARAALGVGE